jgi:uncharacterized protein
MVILITGGTGGIGFETGKQLLQQGHTVLFAGLTPQKDGEIEAKLLPYTNSTPAKWQVYYFDIADRAAIQSFAGTVLKKWGCPDILINNAGYATYETFSDLSEDEIDRLVDVNLKGTLRLTKTFLAHFISRRSGHIINISSVAGSFVLTPNIIYMASKQALNAWSEALRAELHQFGISVSLLCPGRVDTGFFDHPTFKRRQIRQEMKGSILASTVAEKVLQLVKRPGRLVFIPSHFKFIVWIYNTVPGVKYSLFAKLLRNRVRDYERGKK